MDVADIQSGEPQVKDELGERTQKLFQDFLEVFQTDEALDSGSDDIKYLEDARNLIKPERNTLTVSFLDIHCCSQELATVITEEYYRVYPYVCRALRNFVKDQADLEVPKTKEFYVAFTDVPTRLKVRELSTARVGTLIRISGQIVRTHPVHPELTAGSFTCLDCGAVVSNVEQQFKYTQPTICPNAACGNRSRFSLDTRASRFVDFQKIRVQETQAELPRGSIPRSLEVIVRAETVEMAQAGDRCDFIGTLIVVPDVGTLNLPGAKAETGGRNRVEGADDTEGVQGLKSLGVRELHYRLAFLACSVQPTSTRFGSGWMESGDAEDMSPELMRRHMSDFEWERLVEMSNDNHLADNLTSSLFPTIHGNLEVMNGILLMLFGGVAKTTIEGTNLRGDINICIIGDPSTAKSQLLKQVADFSPRAVYTSGKASSAAGLTAAVVKDEESFEFVIEAGALMLADNGVCCIDEFDKMEQRDQVAIHEAMEQQTISITKAGIKATLNARTSILAAANPNGGKYDPSKSLMSNVNMGTPIMSRFDLFFILLDETNEVIDYAIARKIVDLHARLEESVDRKYSPEEILRYITFAKQFKPKIGKGAAKLLVEKYKVLRQRDAGGNGRNSWRITVRQLESMVRLSEAIARMYLCDTVEKRHVTSAYELLNKSIIRVEQPEINLDAEDDPGAGDMDLDSLDTGELDASQMDLSQCTVDELNSSLTRKERVADLTNDVDPLSPPSQIKSDEKSSSALSSKTKTTAKKHKITLSYDEYKSRSNLILMHIRSEEAKLEESGLEIEASDTLRRSAILNWFLEEVEDISTEAELLEKKELMEKVIERLITHDQVIIPLLKSGLGGHAVEEEDPILVVHPNYVLEM